MDHFNVEGVVTAGEVETRVMREARVAYDFRNAFVAGQVRSLEETSLWVQEQISKAGPYDDTRALQALTTWVADKIRSAQASDTSEDQQ